MSRLDSHIRVAQRRLLLGRFLSSLAWAINGVLVVAVLCIVAERLLDFAIPHAVAFLMAGLGLAAVGAYMHAWLHRPTARAAAAAIDRELNLKEAYATTLFCRSSSDPFAVAAASEGEQLAQNVSLSGRFPAQYPRAANAAIGMAGVALCSLLWMPRVDLLGHAQAQKNAALTQIKLEQEKKLEKTAAPVVEALKRTPISAEALKPAQEVAELLKHADGDASKTRLQVVSHLQDVQDELKKSAETEARFRQAQKDEELLKNLESAKDAQTPVGEMQNDIKAQKFDSAVDDLTKAATQFANMDAKQQDAAIKEAQTLAAALSKAANDPQVQQQINQQLQQMAGDPKLANDMAKALADAAQGSPDAAAKLAKLSDQVQKNMNNGQGPTPQQKLAMQQMLANAQAGANSQAQAQQMAQAARDLAKAMADAKAGQTASQQQSASSQAKAGGQPGSPKAGQQAPQPGGTPQQGSKPGQQAGNQGMANAQQNLQKQLEQMKNAQQDAQSLANAQNAAKDAMDQAMQPDGGQQGGNDGMDMNGPGQDGEAQANAQQQQRGAGNGNQNAGGQGQGQVNGGHRGVSAIPITSYSTMDRTQDQENGKMLPSRYVKAGIDAGKANADAKSVAASAEKDDAEDIEQDRIPKEAQKAVRDYFTDLQQQ